MAVVVQGNVTNARLKAVGREQGPDYMLKFLPEIDGAGNGLLQLGNGIITLDSSITELLNVVSYFCSTTRDATLIDIENSVTDDNLAGSLIGAHNHATGLYAASAAIGDTFIASAPRALFSLNTLTETANAAAVIPVGILRRTTLAVVANADPTYEVQAAPTLANVQDITNVMSNCIKQMINILIKTRTIFGPKGWTALFQQVKGGGGTGKTHAKRTHRRHRRRYSSKQY